MQRLILVSKLIGLSALLVGSIIGSLVIIGLYVFIGLGWLAIGGVPIMGSVAAGGLIETYSDVNENLDLTDVLNKKDIFALTVNGDSMIEASIADGDMVLMEPIKDKYALKNGTIVSALVHGLGTTLKYFCKRGGKYS